MYCRENMLCLDWVCSKYGSIFSNEISTLTEKGRLVKAVPFSSPRVENHYFEGTGRAAVKMSWSFATLALGAAAVQTAGGVVVVPVPGQTNSSGTRVSIHNG